MQIHRLKEAEKLRQEKQDRNKTENAFQPQDDKYSLISIKSTV